MAKSRKGQQAPAAGLFDSEWYNHLRYNVVPPLFVICFTGAVQWLGLLGGAPCPFDLDQCPRLAGNQHSWILTGAFLLWVFIWLWIPSKKFKAPLSPEGEIPVYQDNGFQFFLATCALYLILQFSGPTFSKKIVANFPEILACLNTVALGLCLWLCVSARIIKGKMNKDVPFLYDFYRGCELHPRIFGVDAKQFAISRVGMTLWQLLILAAFFDGPQNAPDIVSLLMQTIYIAKFFWWENGYYTTLDMTYDRAGYYLCWGGIAWMPALFPLSQMYMSEYHSTLTAFGSLVVLGIGMVATAIEYRIDWEKEVFVEWRQNYVKNKAKPYNLWGKKVEFLDVHYVDAKGQKVKSALLTSGFWGTARHFNYTLELVCCLTCCVTAGFGQSWLLPLSYFYFIAALIPHRILRDEEKCRNKYGQYWEQYCQKVPYRLLPYVI